MKYLIWTIFDAFSYVFHQIFQVFKLVLDMVKIMQL